LKLSNKKEAIVGCHGGKEGCGYRCAPGAQEDVSAESGNHHASSAHKLLPFTPIYREVEQHLADDGFYKPGVPLKKTKARHFTLLPEKSGFTVSYIPICRRFMVSLVSKLKHDGRPVEKFTGGRLLCGTMWEKYCS
jgi:hypothetical protein